jgi:hypothetical protein
VHVRRIAAENAEVAHREAVTCMKELLRDHQCRQLDVDGFRIRWSAAKGRTSWNDAAIRAAAVEAGVDITQFETTGESADRLVVQDRRAIPLGGDLIKSAGEQAHGQENEDYAV